MTSETLMRGSTPRRALRALALLSVPFFLFILAGQAPVHGQDVTPPSLSSATVGALGSEIALEFDEDLNLPAVELLPSAVAGAFTVTAGERSVTVATVIRESGSKRFLALLFAEGVFIYRDETVVLTYTQGRAGDDALEDESSNKLATFTTGVDNVPAVENLSNESPPRLSSATVSAAGSEIALEFDEDLNLPASEVLPSAVAGAFTVTAGGRSVTVAAVIRMSGTKRFLALLFAEGVLIYRDETVVLTYTQGRAGDDALEDESSNKLATFTTGVDNVPAVENLSNEGPPGAPPRILRATVQAAGTSIDLLFDKHLDLPASEFLPSGLAAAFSVRTEGRTLMIRAVQRPNLDVKRRLTLLFPTDTFIYSGDTPVTLTYDKSRAGTDALEDEEGNDLASFNNRSVSNSSGVLPPLPEAPTELTATAKGSTRIDLRWATPAGSIVTGYRIEVSSDAGNTWTELVADSRSRATSYSHTRLSQLQTRHYRVRAFNARGSGDWSNTANATTLRGKVPDPPQGVLALALGISQINISWMPSGGTTQETGYLIEWSEDHGNTWEDLARVRFQSSNLVYSHNHWNLADGKRVDYRVSSTNANGTGEASPVTRATTHTTWSVDRCSKPNAVWCATVLVARIGDSSKNRGYRFQGGNQAQDGSISNPIVIVEGTRLRIALIDFWYGSVSDPGLRLRFPTSARQVLNGGGYRFWIGDRSVAFTDADYNQTMGYWTWLGEGGGATKGTVPSIGDRVRVEITQAALDRVRPQWVKAFTFAAGNPIAVELSEPVGTSAGDLSSTIRNRFSVRNRATGATFSVDRAELVRASDEPALTEEINRDELRVIRLHLDRNVVRDEFIEVQYGGTEIADVAGNRLQGFTGRLQNFSAATTSRSHATLAPDPIEFDPPAIETVTIVDPPGEDGSWDAGDSLEVEVAFDAPVHVDTSGGTPSIALLLGTEAVSAAYASGSMTDTLTFAYDLPTGAASANSVFIQANAIALNGGTVTSAQGVAADLTHAGGGLAASPPPPPPELTASLESAPDRHDGSSAFNVRIRFTETLKNGALGSKVVRVTNGTNTGSTRIAGDDEIWEITVEPAGNDDITLSLVASDTCESGIACNTDQEPLTEDLTITVPGPEVVALTASLVSAPDYHDGESQFKVRIGFSEELKNGALGSKVVRVSGGSNTGSTRIAGTEEVWEITVEPSGEDDVTLTLARSDTCESGIACTTDQRPLSQALSVTVEGP